MDKDYYKILGVGKTATQDEIKRAYRKLAVQFHPDKNKTKDGEQRFKEVSKAYEALSDPQKRQAYDQFGAAAFEQGAGGGQGPFGGGNPFGGAQGGQYGPFTYTYTSGGGNGEGADFGGFSDPFEIFAQFFGGGSPFGAQRQKRPTYSITIDFIEAVKGVEKQVRIEGKTQKIKIPAGVDDGSRIRFGNYDVVVDVRPSAKFQRQGQDIVSEKEISFSQAVLGDVIEVETIDGLVKLRIPTGTQPETVFRLAQKGVPNPRGSGKGSHYVRIKISIPKNLTHQQKELLKEFDKEGSSKKSWF
ncbi:MAG: molecular chaperone DnaJ [Candidatus Levybacteria bacterium CG_4_9_14_3_um_filter_35_16]|nr:MAG: molecular chaperone DnaJ [Candidatus Levybacteria bacterium CG_4_10_14_0_8_um_filter_35_23]PJA91167.1 MAG: molecular chaperone DnaJ [Candidatus Levybacteria bacterium CG_4_9_14_3_um_filter_35_16]PJC54045.1 MAG: molecular chaperone DnaJ [Candidatus Levybacteria bacterium CG_4_9_14_0_2_um_filter_35_21]